MDYLHIQADNPWYNYYVHNSRHRVNQLAAADVVEMKCYVVIDFSLTVKAATLYSYLGLVWLFHLLKKENQVLFIIF